jgi:tetratricopeptide (TPR) repeat protein
MKNLIKEIFFPILILLALASVYFGGIAPFLRGRAYIDSFDKTPNARTVEDIMEIYNPILDSVSPIGDEEMIQYVGSGFLEIMMGENQPEDAIRKLFDYIEPYLWQNEVRHLLIGAYGRQVLWSNYGQREEDFLKAEEYYRKAIEMGPNLPPVLYEMFNFYYSAQGQEEKAREIGNRILANWPNDEEVRLKMENLE